MSTQKKAKTETDDEEENDETTFVDACDRICGGDLRYVPVLYLELCEREFGIRGYSGLMGYLNEHTCSNTTCGCDALKLIRALSWDLRKHFAGRCDCHVTPFHLFPPREKLAIDNAKNVIESLRKYRICNLHLRKDDFDLLDIGALKSLENEFALNPCYWFLREGFCLYEPDQKYPHYKAILARLRGIGEEEREYYKNIPSMRLAAVRARERNRVAAKTLLLCARRHVSGGVFASDYLPLDMFKIIVVEAALLPPVYFC